MRFKILVLRYGTEEIGFESFFYLKDQKVKREHSANLKKMESEKRDHITETKSGPESAIPYY